MGCFSDGMDHHGVDSDRTFGRSDLTLHEDRGQIILPGALPDLGGSMTGICLTRIDEIPWIGIEGAR